MKRPETGLTAGFWDAVRAGQLVRPVCQDCGKNFFTPQIACPDCLSESWSYQPSTGRGVVHSATVVHRAPSPEFTAPFRLGVVDLEEGWSMLANFVGGPQDRLPAIGAPVRVTWIGRGTDRLPAFTEDVS